MPIFEYKCTDCGTQFEKLLRRASDEAELACPSCGEKRLSPQLSTFAAHSAGPSSSGAAAEMPACPGGMCRTPGLCGRN